MSAVSILPREYQQPLIEANVGQLLREGKSLLSMATATGKTFTSAFIYRSLLAHGALLWNERILFLCHAVDILRHAEEEFSKLFPQMTTGMITGSEKRGVDAQIIFSTFQSSDVLDSEGFSLVIVDESHHGQAPSFKQSILRFTPRYLLGMTATPDRADGVDIREIFGEEPMSYSLAQAIVEEQVCPVNYQLLTIDLSRDELKRIQQELEAGVRLTRSQIERRLFSATKNEMFIDTINAYQGKKIVFCESIAEAEELAKHLDDAMSYHSDLSSQDRKVVFEWFATGLLATITVVDAFNEGINIPDANQLIFLRSTQSKTVFLQQLGRGLRKTEGKESVNVHDFVGNLTRLQDLLELGREIREHQESRRGERVEEHEENDGGSPLFSLENFFFDISEETVDLLGVLRLIERNILPFAEARALARQQGWKSAVEYNAKYRQVPGLPSNPYKVYASTGWVGMPDFLGTETTLPQSPKDILPFAEARALARQQGWKSGPEYHVKYRQVPGLPANPYRTYASTGWVSMPDFLGTETTPRQYSEDILPFAEARALARQQGWKSGREYKVKYRQVPGLPSDPQEAYASTGWVSMPDFLGTETTPRQYSEDILPFAEARALVRQQGWKSGREYRVKYRQVPGLPSNPYMVYASTGWVGMPDFLGTKRS